MTDETSTFDDDVDEILAEQARQELQQQKSKSVPPSRPALSVTPPTINTNQPTRPKPIASPLAHPVAQQVAQNTKTPSTSIPDSSGKTEIKKKSRGKRWLVFLAVTVAALGFLGVYLPQLIVSLGYGPDIVNTMLKPYGMKAEFQIVTLEWSKPIELKSIRLSRINPLVLPPSTVVTPPAGASTIPAATSPAGSNPIESQLATEEELLKTHLLDLDTFQSTRTLWEIFQNPSNIGTVKVDKPKAVLVMASNDRQESINNWSDIIASMMNQKTNSPGQPLEVRVTHGTIDIHDLNKKQKMSVVGMNLDLLHNLDPQLKASSGTGSCNMGFNVVMNDQQRPFTTNAAWGTDGGNLAMKSEQFPLSLLQPYLNQLKPGHKITGDSTGVVTMNWLNQPQFQLSRADFSVNMEKVAFTCQEMHPRIITVPKMQLKCSPRFIYSTTTGNPGNSSPTDKPQTSPVSPIPIQPATAGTHPNNSSTLPSQLDSSTQIPSSWDVTAVLETPMIITPAGQTSPQGQQQLQSIWNDPLVQLTANLEVTGLIPSVTQTAENPASSGKTNLSNQPAITKNNQEIQILFRDINLKSQTANIIASGMCKDLTHIPVIQLNMTGTVNSNKLLPVIDTTLAQNFKFENMKLLSGSLNGPLWDRQVAKTNPQVPPAIPSTNGIKNSNPIESAILDLPGSDLSTLTFYADLQWATANILGIATDQGTLNAVYSGDTLKLKPSAMKVLNGLVQTNPTLKFTSNDVLIHIPAGTVWDRARITKEFAQQYLSYTSPVFAEATSVEGEFSLVMPESHFSLNQLLNPNLNKDNYRGDLLFYQAKAGPGAMFGDIVQIVESIRMLSGKQGGGGILNALGPQSKWVEIPNQTVKLQMTNGRVYHDQITYMIANTPLISTGSVGAIDQTLSVTMKATLPESDRKILKLVASQDVILKFSGTVKKPILDKGSLASWGQNLGTGAAANLINNLIEKRKEKKGN